MALIDKASLLMVPSTYEAGTLYNVLPSGNRAPDSTDQNSGYDQTRADFTFDRGSNAAATRVNSDGLIEKYRENKLLQSNQFDTTWTLYSVTATSGFEGYDGSSDAWQISTTGVNGFENLNQNISFSGVHTISMYAKAGSNVYFTMRSLGTDIRVQFKLDDGTHSTTFGSPIDTFMQNVGSGWYRCGFTANFSSASEWVFYPQRIGIIDAGNIYIQNAQLESSMVATDYLDSGATTAKAGVLIDLPRINYDANGENGALLLEPSRQQLIQYSEYFGASNWNKLAVNLTANNVESPEGGENAYLFVPTSSGGQIYDSIGKSASSIKYTASLFVKAKELTSLRMYVHGTSNANRGDATFNLSTESATYSNFGTFTETFADVEDYGNDWYRCILTTKTDTSTGLQLVIRYDGSTNSADGLYIFGAQLEAGSYATSYIPNHGTSGGVTRAADSCSVTGVSDVIGQTEGTIFVDVPSLAGETNGYVLECSDGSNTNRIIIQRDSTNDYRIYVQSSAGVQLNNAFSGTFNSNAKIAFAYANNDYNVYVNGVSYLSGTTFDVPACTQINIGERYNNTTQLGGGVQQAAIFNERLSNAELATLTTL